MTDGNIERAGRSKDPDRSYESYVPTYLRYDEESLRRIGG